MEKCEVISFITPDKYELDGLWFGDENPSQVLIFVHGLSGSAFGNHKLLTGLVDKNLAVIFFNNRGYTKIARVKKVDLRRRKGYKSKYIGEVHEVFSDCVSDIQGAVDYARSRGAEKVLLVGHSTGCQKSIYYLSRKGKQGQVKGVVLLAPMSDYAAALKHEGAGKLRTIEEMAKDLVNKNKPGEILPLEIWPAMHDAQRWLSLYTPDSEEEIFSYAQSGRIPATLRKVKTPILVVFAGDDEYRDRSNKQLVKWFDKNIKTKNKKIVVIEKAPHSFRKYETKVAQEIADWLNTIDD